MPRQVIYALVAPFAHVAGKGVLRLSFVGRCSIVGAEQRDGVTQWLHFRPLC